MADGMPIVWASRLQRTPLPQRVAGSDLIDSLASSAADAGYSVFLLGGNPGTAEATSKLLCRKYPRLRLAGWYDPRRALRKAPRVLRRPSISSRRPLPISFLSPWALQNRSSSFTPPVRDCLPRGGLASASASASCVVRFPGHPCGCSMPDSNGCIAWRRNREGSSGGILFTECPSPLNCSSPRQQAESFTLVVLIVLLNPYSVPQV